MRRLLIVGLIGLTAAVLTATAAYLRDVVVPALRTGAGQAGRSGRAGGCRPARLRNEHVERVADRIGALHGHASELEASLDAEQATSGRRMLRSG